MFVTAKGVTLVDTKNPGWGQPLLDKIKTLTDKPVTTVINTHTHFDHVSGNVAMPADGRDHRARLHREENAALSTVTGRGETRERLQGRTRARASRSARSRTS